MLKLINEKSVILNHRRHLCEAGVSGKLPINLVVIFRVLPKFGFSHIIFTNNPVTLCPGQNCEKGTK